MTNDHAILIAAASLVGKTINLGIDGYKTLNTLEDALDIARQMHVTQVNHTRLMMTQAAGTPTKTSV